jgi:hypothetical protein
VQPRRITSSRVKRLSKVAADGLESGVLLPSAAYRRGRWLLHYPAGASPLARYFGPFFSPLHLGLFATPSPCLTNSNSRRTRSRAHRSRTLSYLYDQIFIVWTHSRNYDFTNIYIQGYFYPALTFF